MRFGLASIPKLGPGFSWLGPGSRQDKISTRGVTVMELLSSVKYYFSVMELFSTTQSYVIFMKQIHNESGSVVVALIWGNIPTLCYSYVTVINY